MLKNITISQQQLMAMVVVFVWGTSVIVPPATTAKQGAWLAIILGALWSIGLILIHSYLIKLYPGKSLLEILDIRLGSILGKLISLQYIFFFVLLSALVLRNVTDFLLTTVLQQTPEFAIALSLILLSAYTINKGISVIANLGVILFFVTIFFVTLVTMASIFRWQLNRSIRLAMGRNTHLRYDNTFFEKF